MADRSSERDRRVRQLMGNKNPGFDVMGQAQAEIQDAQSELYNHIALQNAQEQSRLQETATISQAAAGMMAMGGGDQLQAQAARMNPSTQAALGKFGVRPQQSQNTARNTQSQRVVTKSGDITNIRNENITNNKTDIKVTQPSIPVQQSPVIVGGARKEDSTAKFKAWLSGMFARQQNEAEIQRKEYRKKEWNLGRTTSRLMKKIGEATSNLGNRLDPKNMTTTLGGQLKWLLLIFGATMIGKVWKPAMKFLANIEGGIRAAFGLPMNDELRGNAGEGLSIVDKIKEAIGMDPRHEDRTLIQGIGDVFMEGIDKLIDKLKFWFEDRAQSMKEVEFPQVKTSVLHPYDSIVNAVKGMGQYLGDIITVAFGGSKGKVKIEASHVEEQARESFTNTRGRQTTPGDSALMTGGGRNYMRNSDYDIAGNLKGNASSTQAMSRSLISMFDDRSGVGHTAEIATGVSQLFRTADRQGQVVIDPELLIRLGLSQQDLMTLQREGRLTQKQYKIIAVNPTEAQKTEMGAYDGSAGFWSGGTVGSVAGAASGAASGAAIGSAILPGWGTAIGGVIGGVSGFFTGGAVGSGLGSTADTLIRNWTTKGYYPTLVPADSNEVSADGSLGIPKTLWVLDRRGAEQVKGKISAAAGMSRGEEMNLTSGKFYEFLRRRGETIARQNGVTLGGEAINTNKLRTRQAEYQNYLDRWNWKFESEDPNSENEQNYHHANAVARTASRALSRAGDAITSGISWVGDEIRGMGITQIQQNQRAAWLMRKAMEYGFTREQAAGIAGNAMRESELCTETAFNSNDNGQGAGGGLAGWLGDNLKEVLTYARDLYGQNVNPNNPSDIKKVPFEVQSDILLRQLTGDLRYSYRGRGLNAGNAIKRATTVEEATRAMDRHFEVSAEGRRGDYGRRIGYATDFMRLDISTVDLSAPALGSPIAVGFDDMMNGKSGSTPDRIKNWLWGGGNAPKEYDPRDEATAWSFQVQVQVPIHKPTGEEGVMGITVNRRLAENVALIFREIFDEFPTFTIDPDYTGGYCFRKVNSGSGRPSNKLSNHAYGGAIDINYNVNKLHDTNTQNTTTHLGTREHPVVQIFYRHGWIWGGVWRNKDKMHFEYGGGETGGNLNGGTFGEITTFVGDLLTGANSETPGNPLVRPMTAEQQQAAATLASFDTFTNQVRGDALFRGGAKVDEYGVYIDTGQGIHAYLKNDATALNGSLRGRDVDFVARVNSETGRLEDVSEEEERLARDSVQVNMAAMFSSYEGKGSIDDRMTGRDRQPLRFDLGEFTDIDSFSEYAKEQLKGKIHFFVFLTKDGSGISYIEIEKKFRSGLNINLETSALTAEQLEDVRYVGPVIFELGKKWYNPFSNGRGRTTSDYQPTAEYHNVKLTPRATEAKNRLLRYIAMGRIIEENGRLYAGGRELSDAEKEEMEKFRILTKGTHGFRSRHNTNTHWWGNSVVASGDYNNAIGVARSVVSEGGKFKTDDYFSSLGTSFDDKQTFFNEHRDIFVYHDGKIIGPGGAVWGTYTEDENGRKTETFYGKEDFERVQRGLGNEGLRENATIAEMNIQNRHLSTLGRLNYNAAGDFVRELQNTDFSNIDLMARTKARILRQNGNVRITKIMGQGKIKGATFKYGIFTDPDGEILFYKSSKEQLKKFVKDLIGGDLNNDTNISAIPEKGVKANTLDDLYTQVIRIAANSLINAGKYADNAGFKRIDENDTTRQVDYVARELSENHETDNQREGDLVHGKVKKRTTWDKLASHLKHKGKLIEKIETYGRVYFSEGKTGGVKVYYQDGEVEELLESTHGMWFPDKNMISSDWWENVNSEITQTKQAATIENAISIWENPNNNYKASLDQLVEKARAGQIHYNYNDDGTVTLDDGTVFDTWDKSGPKPPANDGQYHGRGGITSDHLRGDAALAEKVTTIGGYFNNNSATKLLYYQKYYGAVPESDGLWIYSKDKKFRTKVNLDVPLSDETNFLIKDSTEAYDSQKGEWVNLKNIGHADLDESSGEIRDSNWLGSDFSGDEALEHGFGAIVEGLEGIESKVNLNASYNAAIAEGTGDQVTQGVEAARQTIAQIIQAKEALASSRNQEDYLRILANEAVGGGILTEEKKNQLMAEIERRTKAAHADAIRSAVLATGISAHHSFNNANYWAGSSLLTTDDGKNYVVDTKAGNRLLEVKRDSNGDLRLYTTGMTGAVNDGKLTIINNNTNQPVSTVNILHRDEVGNYAGVVNADGHR